MMRMRDALDEVREFSTAEEQLDESLLGFMRTGAIAVNVRNSVQSGKKIQQHARELRNIGNKLSTRKDPEDAQKEVAEGFRTLSDLFIDMEEMMRRTAFISASGGVFSDRSYALLKKITKKM